MNVIYANTNVQHVDKNGHIIIFPTRCLNVIIKIISLNALDVETTRSGIDNEIQTR